MQIVEPDALLTVGDLAARSGVSAQTIRRLEAARQIPIAQRSGPAGVRLWRGSDALEVIRVVTERRAARGVAA